MKIRVAGILVGSLLFLLQGCTHVYDTPSAKVGANKAAAALPTGLGGTGMMAHATGSGLGGTGIVGSVTGFGSILVNGYEVFYDESTPVKLNGLPAKASDLHIGQVVKVLAEKISNHHYKAKLIIIVAALHGPVTKVHPQLEVMGVPLMFVDKLQTPAFSLGEIALVHGHWIPTGGLHVKHIQKSEDASHVDLIGAIKAVNKSALNVSGVTVKTDINKGKGHSALVRGQWNGKAIVAKKVKVNTVLPFAKKKIHELCLEAYVQSVNKDGSFKILASVLVKLDKAVKLKGLKKVRPGQLVQVYGGVEGDVLIAESIKLVK